MTTPASIAAATHPVPLHDAEREAQEAERDRLLVEFDAWLSFRPEFAEVLAAFRDAFGTNTSAAAEASR